MNEGESNSLSSAELELERALASLTPCDPGLDASSALFEAGRLAGAAAGRRNGRRSLFIWRTTAAALAVMAGASLMTSSRRDPQRDPQPPIAAIAPPPVLEPVSGPIDLPPPSRGDDLLTLRSIVLAEGIDALPRSTFGSAGTAPRIADERQ